MGGSNGISHRDVSPLIEVILSEQSTANYYLPTGKEDERDAEVEHKNLGFPRVITHIHDEIQKFSEIPYSNKSFYPFNLQSIYTHPPFYISLSTSTSTVSSINTSGRAFHAKFSSQD